MKRVLMIIPFFPPMAGGGVYRPLSFVKYLGRHGWEPTVIAPRGDAFWIRDEALVDQIPASCRVVRTDTWSGQAVLHRLRRRGAAPSQRRSSRGFGALRRVASALVVPDTYRGWYPHAVRAARREVKSGRFDAVYSTSPPETSHLVARDVVRASGLPWVADFRDPWMNLHLSPPPTRLHAMMHRRLERSVCTRAHVVVTTEWHERMIRDAYPGTPGVTRIPNGYDGAEAASVDGVLPPARPMRIVHAGMLTQTRTALPFFSGLRRFLDEHPKAAGDVEVLFVGAREDANERAAVELGVGDVVRFADTMPHHEALQTERAAHILLLIKHVNPRYTGLVPGKLYEYVGMRRPILAVVPEGEARRVIERLRRGEVPAQEDPVDVARALGVLYGHYRAGTLESAYDLEPHPELTRERLAGEMAALLDDLTEGGEPR